MPKLTHADRLLERGAITKKQHAVLKAEGDDYCRKKEEDAMFLSVVVIAKAMKREV